MADPLSVAGSTIRLISLGVQIIGGLWTYYDAYRDRDETVRRILDRLKTLQNIFQELEKTIQLRQFRSDEAHIIAAIESSVNKSEENISALRKKCDKIQKSTGQSLKGSIVLAGRQIIYPFRASTLTKLDENIRAIQDNLVIALDIFLLRGNQQLQRDTDDIKELTNLLYASQISSDIRQWLNAPDPSINHNSNCAKRHPGTGLWFIQGPQFTTWLDQPNSFLWIAAFAGSGKSVLCSTAIQHAYRRKYSTNSHVAIACFYFTFTDESKRDSSAMLRALILQLSGQADSELSGLRSFHSTHRAGVPPTATLLEHLHAIVQRFDHVYILVDALDEVPRGRVRQNMLRDIRKMQGWSCPGLHILVTSRDEVDISDKLPVDRQTTELQAGPGVNRDIRDFIECQLKIDTDLLKWKKYHDKILRTLSDKAHGIFRWVECQLEAIRQCPRSAGQLNECLRTLPEDLDETYERILCSIKGQSARDARRILLALSFSVRPLTVSELIDIIAIDIESSPHLNRDFRYEDADSLRQICPGLIQIYVPDGNGRLPWPSGLSVPLDTPVPTVRIAHFSVQEYLISSRIEQQQAKYFALNKSAANAEMTKICISYLFESELASQNLDIRDLEDLPFAEYAVFCWSQHYHQITHPNDIVNSLVLGLLNSGQTFWNWVRVYEYGRPLRVPTVIITPKESTTPLYYASLLDLQFCVKSIIDAGFEINVQGGHLDTALQAASARGHTQVVQILLDKGADVNAQGGQYGSALQAAEKYSYTEIAQLLRKHGAIY